MLTHPNFDPVALDLGFAQVHWYGLMYLAGFSFAYWITKKYAKEGRIALKPEQVDDAIFWGAIGIVVGARLGYVLFYGFDNFLENPLWALKVWQGGMSFHGGFLGVVLAVVLFARKHNIRIGSMCDALAIAAPMGLFFGRMGNFIGQELWGRPTDVPWGMIFPNDPSGLARHPSQLYQGVCEGLLVFAIIFFYTRKPRPEWSAGALFVLSYGCFRFLMEFVREPDAHIGFDLFGWMSRGQILSIPMIMVGAIVMIWAYQREAAKAKL